MNLEEFIKVHKDLISVSGVFAALTVFSQQLVGGIVGNILALAFLLGFLLTWAELISTFPEVSRSKLRLFSFQAVLIFSGLALIFYWYLRVKMFFPEYFPLSVAFPVSLAISLIILEVLRRNGSIEWLNNFKRVDSFKSKLIYISALLIIGAIALLPSIKLAEFFTRLIDFTLK